MCWLVERLPETGAWGYTQQCSLWQHHGRGIRQVTYQQRRVAGQGGGQQ